MTILMLSITIALGNGAYKLTDRYLRDRVFLIHSPEGMCSAIQVRAPSNKIYMLSAAHCLLLFHDNKIAAVDERGKEYTVTLIAEDPRSDLILMSAATGKYIDIATSLPIHTKIHTMTHGRGFPSYRTDGEFLDHEHVTVPLRPITTMEDMNMCLIMPKYHADLGEMGLTCYLSLDENMTTAFVLPGSSGGAVVNESNELIGIVSASYGPILSALVTLEDIQAFMADK